MPNLAAQARQRMQVEWPGATVSGRARGRINHAHPSIPNKFSFDGQAGAKWHFGGILDEAHEVDTDWVDAHPIDDAPWLKKMVLNDFHVFFGPGTDELNAGQIIKYVHVDSGEELTFQLMQLQWTNDLDQISSIEDPQQISPTTIIEDEIQWDDGFGTGLDFFWRAEQTRLSKWLKIESLALLGSPPQFIIDGGNPKLRIGLIFQISNDVDVYVDGVEWDKTSDEVTSADIEFRLAATQEALWKFRKPKGYDQGSPDPPDMSLRVGKTGPNLIVDVFTPWSWLETAVYPVHLDTTVDEQVPGGGSDAYEKDDNTTFNSGTNYIVCDSNTVQSSRYNGGFHYSVVAIEGTIDVAYIELYGWASHDDWNIAVHANDVDDANDFSAEADVTGRAITSASVSFDDIGVGAGWYGSGYEIKTVIQEIVDRGSWASGNDLCIIAKGESDADYSGWCTSYEGNSAQAAKLHVEYTAGAAGPPFPPLFRHRPNVLLRR
jgi:hypothetical protein